MCRFGEPGETAYTALWPDHDAALVVEEYSFLPIDSQVCSSGPFSSAFTLVSHEDFLRWRDIKLYMHNGMHAFVSYRASLEGVKFFPQVSQELRDEARLAVLEEVLPAILHAHPLTNRRELEEYGLGLLSRFFSPIFNDSIERGVRGARDKLTPTERLVGGCSFIRKAGIEPRHYSTAVDAARQVLALQDGEQASLLAEGR
jgi:mannitol-1-phosphate/altronate dehydrogenase